MPGPASTVQTVPEQGVRIKKRQAEDRFGRTVSEYCSPMYVSQHAYQQFESRGVIQKLSSGWCWHSHCIGRHCLKKTTSLFCRLFSSYLLYSCQFFSLSLVSCLVHRNKCLLASLMVSLHFLKELYFISWNFNAFYYALILQILSTYLSSLVNSN